MSSPFETPDLRATDASRSIQDAIIVSFVAILCSYYWVTSAWPYIQGALETRKEKLLTMEKLKKKQRPLTNCEVDLILPSVASKTRDDMCARVVTKKFQLAGPTLNYAADNDPDILVPLGGEYILDDSDATFDYLKTTLDYERISQNDPKATTMQGNLAVLIDADTIDSISLIETLTPLEDVNTDPIVPRDFASSVSLDPLSAQHSESVGDGGDRKPSNKLGDGSVIEPEVNLTDLWSHISRTSSTIHQTAFLDEPHNPWCNSVTANAARHTSELATSEGVSAETYSADKELRAQQDKDYALSLATDVEKDASLLRITQKQVPLIEAGVMYYV